MVAEIKKCLFLANALIVSFNVLQGAEDQYHAPRVDISIVEIDLS